MCFSQGAGADTNVSTKMEWTPLHWAARQGKQNIIIQYNSKIHIQKQNTHSKKTLPFFFSKWHTIRICDVFLVGVPLAPGTHGTLGTRHPRCWGFQPNHVSDPESRSLNDMSICNWCVQATSVSCVSLWGKVVPTSTHLTRAATPRCTAPRDVVAMTPKTSCGSLPPARVSPSMHATMQGRPRCTLLRATATKRWCACLSYHAIGCRAASNGHEALIRHSTICFSLGAPYKTYGC